MLRKYDRWVYVGLALASLYVSGCSTYANKSLLIKTALLENDYEKALENVESIDQNRSQLLYFYEKGLILHYSDRYEESNAVFDEAELLLEELYTKSVTRELAALAVSDAIAKYRGDPFEAVLVNYYRILNYLHLGQPDAALVECRKVNQKLEMIQGSSDENYFENDPFLQYLTAMVYEAAGEVTDAEVSYRVAVKTFEFLSADYRITTPAQLYCDAAAMAAYNGDREEAESYAEKATCEAEARGSGRVNLFLECGYIAHKEEENIVLPIFSNDSWNNNAQFAVVMSGRRGVVYPSSRKVDYWLRIALPKIVQTPVSFDRAVITARTISPPNKAGETETDLVENLDTQAVVAYTEAAPKVFMRAIIRALIKYAAKKAADEENEGLGALVNLFGVVTETADTRSWSVLPEKILMGRLTLPPGTYDLNVVLYDGAGRVVDTFDIPAVGVTAGSSTFLNYRVY